MKIIFKNLKQKRATCNYLTRVFSQLWMELITTNRGFSHRIYNQTWGHAVHSISPERVKITHWAKVMFFLHINKLKFKLHYCRINLPSYEIGCNELDLGNILSTNTTRYLQRMNSIESWITVKWQFRGIYSVLQRSLTLSPPQATTVARENSAVPA